MRSLSKLYANSYTSVVNPLRRHTYIQAQPETKAPWAPAAPARLCARVTLRSWTIISDSSCQPGSLSLHTASWDRISFCRRELAQWRIVRWWCNHVIIKEQWVRHCALYIGNADQKIVKHFFSVGQTTVCLVEWVLSKAMQCDTVYTFCASNCKHPSL